MQIEDVIPYAGGKGAEFVKIDGEWWHKLDGRWLVETTGQWLDPFDTLELEHELWTRKHKAYTPEMLTQRVDARELAEAERARGER